MVTSSIIRHLLCDDDSLSSYFNGKLVSFGDVKRRLLLLERRENSFIADHYYRLNQEKSFDGINSLSEILNKGLFRIADNHLELKNNRIYVKQEKQNEWQELITRIPPLVLQATFLHIHKPLASRKTCDVQNYFKNIILPNARYTALPYPYIPQLEEYIKQKNGLHDLHIHLNGSTETDIAWQDFLKAPDKVYKELNNSYEKQLTKEQFEQESHLTDPIKFRDSLLIARKIRNYIFSMLYPYSLVKDDKDNKDNKDDHNKIKSLDQLLQKIQETDSDFYDGIDNPFGDLMANKDVVENYPMSIECLMYVLIFQYLSEKPKESISSLFHFYLLILGLANRLLVQQTRQNGFEQFQKQTENDLRAFSEKKYKNRFLQLHGNELRNIRFMEGQFSPKVTREDNQILLHKIFSSWNSFKKQLNNNQTFEQDKIIDINEDEPPTLKLIAHFIKLKDAKRETIRHKTLRKSIWEKATVLCFMKEKSDSYIKDVIGVDAAASEFDAPPEVFAPAFRLLRRRGFEHFTFHAGEDFFHVISGLRAIYESIVFFDLKHGDRIGHAVASGVDTQIWINNVGKSILIRQGEQLDNLLFSYHLIVKEKIDSLKSYLPLLAHEISKLSFDIYKEFYPVDVQLEAWLLRKYCPMLLLSGKKEFAEPYSVYCDLEWNEITENIPSLKNSKYTEALTEKDIRVEILEKYHNIEYRRRYEKIIEIDSLAIFDMNAIKELQLAILKYMHKKEIVIETLPTSNVRIGQHHNYDTYHLWNWVKWEEEGHSIPPIVVGTDDTGIFATNIYNEYANIYCHLTSKCKMTHDKVMTLIEKLDKNASIYKFE